MGMDGIPNPAVGWAADGPRGGDTAYRAQSLKYTPIEVGLNESVPAGALLRLWLTAAALSSIVYVFFFVLWLLSGEANSSQPGLYGESSGPSFGLLIAGFWVSFILFWAVLLLSRTSEPIAEWKVLLEERAAAADRAYAAIYGSLARRRIPVDVRPSRVRSDIFIREVVNNRLMIRDRAYVAYATVFAYGTSLYVGWTMWRNRLGAQLIGTFLKDLIGGVFGRTDPIRQMLRTEKVRAMREAVHSAVREGVENAIDGVELSISSTFGYEIPIQDLTVPAVPSGAYQVPSGAHSAQAAPAPVPPQSRATAPQPPYPQQDFSWPQGGAGPQSAGSPAQSDGQPPVWPGPASA